jgi:hypothetical protein
MHRIKKTQKVNLNLKAEKRAQSTVTRPEPTLTWQLRKLALYCRQNAKPNLACIA